ncbi:MAG: cytochrome c biogenesis protein CcsA [Bacteroidetes bacterium]|nr:cytochrome c biogenesis protein CcsA [Bacteroidota bacterium]
MQPDIQYIGEHLFWGKAGNLLIIVAFVASLVSAVSYAFLLRTNDISWKNLARKAFAVHTFSIIGIFCLLFYLILNQRLEYYYVWEHSNSIMPLKYILSCFWEGQEGSFLLWMFWHSILSWIIIWKSGEWEAGVMAVISMVQVFLVSMIIGVVVFGHKFGSNPFVLLRDHPDFANFPFIKMPDYLSQLKDGRGLNPLLQNYWMTIHPPTLFLGFASTVIPFAFAVAGLLRKRYTEWITPALPWTFFGVMILGTGILMGAAWAYESLSFGGFWAWDPVENASLVPWMTLVGAAHVMLVFKHKKTSVLSSYLLSILTFILILYSTFLTRSGILGNTSVHAFTDLGMTGHLLIYMAFFSIVPIVLLVKNYKQISSSQDEHLSSREFWMFIGMLILLIGAIQVTSTTSIPVWNKIFHANIAPPPNPIEHYNSWQIPVAIFVCLLIGIGQFLRYKKSEGKVVLKKILPAFIASLLVTVWASFFLGDYRVHYYGLLFASVFAILANLDFILRVLNGKMEHSGASVAHIGIGMILLGALISNSKQQVISQNVKNVNLGKDFPNQENIFIEQKTDTLPMGEYFVTYKGKERKGVNVIYTIEYFTRNKTTGLKEKAFELHPIVQTNDRMGNVSEPSTQRFLTRDIYTHITFAEQDNSDNENSTGEYQPAKTHTVAVGDTFMTSNSFVILEGLSNDINRSEFGMNDSDVAVGAKLRIEDMKQDIYHALPVFVIKNLHVFSKESKVDELGLKFSFTQIDPSTGKIELTVNEKKSNKHEFIIMKAIVFPGINILWMGCILMMVGSIMAIRKRIARK